MAQQQQQGHLDKGDPAQGQTQWTENKMTTTYFHGSDQCFDQFNSHEVFIAKSPTEAMTYGRYLYEVQYEGEPIFDTPTIQLIKPSQVTSVVRVDVDLLV